MSNKKVWADPNSTFNQADYRQKMSKIAREVSAEPEVRERRCHAQMQSCSNSERRREASKRMFKLHADPDSSFNQSEYRAKKVQNALDFWSDYEKRQQHSEKIQSLWNSDNSAHRNNEYRHFRSDISKKLWSDPNYRDRCIASFREACNDPSRREEMSKRTRDAWCDPDYRERVTLGLIETWSNPELRQRHSDDARRRFAERANIPYTSKPIEQLTEADRRRWVNQVKERDGWSCQECGSKENLHAHHIKLKAFYPELADNINNGITLCEVCHAKKHPYISWMKKILERANEEAAMV